MHRATLGCGNRCRRRTSAAGLASLLLGSAGSLPRVPSAHWKPFASLVLEAAYEATMLAAVLNKQRGASNVVLPTLLGGGAFGNEAEWIQRSYPSITSNDVEFWT
jgi:hypothetical protein